VIPSRGATSTTSALFRDERDRREILERIVAQSLEQVRVGREAVEDREQRAASGAALATASVPIVRPRPPGCRSGPAAERLAERRRQHACQTSVAPPGFAGTIMRIGFAGQGWAAPAAACSATSSRPAAVRLFTTRRGSSRQGYDNHVSEEKVTFASEGLRLSGVVSVPAAAKRGERRAAFIVLHGFGSNKNANNVLDPCKVFDSLGTFTLRFDMRAAARSEGERGRVICLEQVQNTRDALVFLAGHPAVAAGAHRP